VADHERTVIDMGNVDAPDLFALRAEIADLTTRAADFAAGLAPLIADYHRVGELVSDLADRGAVQGEGLGVELGRYEDWGKLTGYGALTATMSGIAGDVNG
jgi:hypothetical protein